MADAVRYKELKERIEQLESRVVSLTSSQKTTDDDIDDIATKIADLDHIIRGDGTARDLGILGQVNKNETDLNSVLRVFFPDHTGHGGIVQDIKELKAHIHGKFKDTEHWLLFWAKVIGVIGGIAGVAVSTWPTLYSYWKDTSKDMKTLNRQIERTKHPRVKKIVPRIVPKVEPPESDNGDEEK